MRFKNILHYTIGLALCFSSLSCGEYLNGQKKKEQTLALELKETECLQGLPDFVAHYFSDQSSAAQVQESFQCLQSSLGKFKRYTRGASEDQYTYVEVQHFFNRYLLENQKISDEMMLEFMKIKVWAVGGSHRAITRIELEQLNDYLSVVSTELQRLNGFWKIFLFAEKRADFNADKFKLAMQTLKPALTNLIFESKGSGSQYEFQDLEKLFQNLSQLLEKQGEISTILKWFPVANAAKKSFLGEFLQVTSRSEWKKVIDWTLESYETALIYYFQIHQMSLKEPQNFDVLIDFSDRLLRLVESSKVMEERGRISLEAVDELIKSFHGTGILPKSMTAELLQNTYKKVLFHWLEGRRENASLLQGIELRHISVLRFEYEVWRQNQLSLNRMFARTEEMTSSEIGSNLKRVENSSMKGALLRSQYDLAWKRWSDLLKSGTNLQFEKDLRLSLQASQGSTVIRKYNFPGLSMSNAMFSVTRLWMRGYGDTADGDYSKTSMSEKSLIQMEQDFREIGSAIGLLDERTPDPAARSFKEANYFTFSGDGNDRLDSQETYELLHFLVSGGFSVTDRFYGMALAAGCGLESLDPFGSKRLNLSCVKKTFFAEALVLLSHMPNMVKALGALSEAAKDKMFMELNLVSQVPEPRAGETERSELRTFFSVLQYVESLLIQYDKNQNQLLSKEELQNAEPRFHSFIASVSPIKQNTFVREVFLYILVKGEVPPQSWGQMNSSHVRYSLQRVTGGLQEINRFDLIKVLGVLKSNGHPN